MYYNLAKLKTKRCMIRGCLGLEVGPGDDCIGAKGDEYVLKPAGCRALGCCGKTLN